MELLNVIFIKEDLKVFKSIIFSIDELKINYEEKLEILESYTNYFLGGLGVLRFRFIGKNRAKNSRKMIFLTNDQVLFLPRLRKSELEKNKENREKIEKHLKND